MLTHFDDYPIHQTPEPVAHTASPSRNFYDRYFFNGYSPRGDFYFAVAMGLYPNRRVMDASVSAVRGGRQFAVHASRRAPGERSETRVGPIAIDVVEPMRTLRVRIAENEHGLSWEMLFRARSEALEEPRAVRRHDGLVFMDSTRFTQFGTWEGELRVDGETIALDVPGCRDRSWGERPVGEPPGGAPTAPGQVLFLWSPLQFDDAVAHLGTFEDDAGQPWHAHGVIAPTLEAGGEPEVATHVAHRVQWIPGTRRSEGAELDWTFLDGRTETIRLEPLLTFQMLGLGYLNPDWGHGVWRGEDVVGGSQWTLKDMDPLDPRHIHVQQVCRAHWGEREGIGVLEQLAIGPHAGYGFESLFDGAK